MGGGTDLSMVSIRHFLELLEHFDKSGAICGVLWRYGDITPPLFDGFSSVCAFLLD